MLYRNLIVALLLFFGWLGADAIVSLLGNPLDGVHYPMQSPRMRAVVYSETSWIDKTSFTALFFLVMFGLLWWFFIRQAGMLKGARVASIITAFTMLSFWFVPAVSADLHDLELNGWWLASMIYCNIAFFLYGFLGRGSIDDMHF